MNNKEYQHVGMEQKMEQIIATQKRKFLYFKEFLKIFDVYSFYTENHKGKNS